jgi:hypothetical protein
MSATARRLPFTMKTVFQDVFLLTYAVRPDVLAALLPPCIVPCVRDGESFISIVVANIRGMRPAIFPEFLGTNYYQIVYRAVVRIPDAEHGERPGVFFLRSDSNDPVMTYCGNRLTEFRFHYFHTGAIDLFQRRDNVLITAETADGRGDLLLHLRHHGPADGGAPAECFQSVRDEKETLVELFHAFSHDAENDVVYDLEIERGEWRLERLEQIEFFSAFFEEGPFTRQSARPISHLHIRECSYVWKPMVAIPTSGHVCSRIWNRRGSPLLSSACRDVSMQ